MRAAPVPVPVLSFGRALLSPRPANTCLPKMGVAACVSADGRSGLAGEAVGLTLQTRGIGYGETRSIGRAVSCGAARPSDVPLLVEGGAHDLGRRAPRTCGETGVSGFSRRPDRAFRGGRARSPDASGLVDPAGEIGPLEVIHTQPGRLGAAMLIASGDRVTRAERERRR